MRRVYTSSSHFARQTAIVIRGVVVVVVGATVTDLNFEIATESLTFQDGLELITSTIVQG